MPPKSKGATKRAVAVSKYVILDAGNVMQSMGDWAGGQLPNGWTAAAISDADFLGLQQGLLLWSVDHTIANPSVAQQTQAAATIADLLTKAVAALTTNVHFEGTVAGRSTNIASGKSTAQTGTTATVSSIANAQTQVRSIWTVLVQVATALDDFNTQLDAISKQNDAIIKLLAGQVNNRIDLLQDSTGT